VKKYCDLSFSRFGFRENIYRNLEFLSIVISWLKYIADVDLRGKSKSYPLPPIKAASVRRRRGGGFSG